MAARVSEVTDYDEVARLNVLLHERYPEQGVFAPREASSALLKATPTVVSIIDLAKGPGQPQLVILESQTVVRPADGAVPAAERSFGPPGHLG